MRGLKKLKSGNFNDMNQEWLPDGSVIITLTSRKWKGIERFRVRNLYKSNEEELDIESGKPITKRDKRHTVS
ncbi:hypothetical protein ES708_31087 [subsurface metagenome]